MKFKKHLSFVFMLACFFMLSSSVYAVGTGTSGAAFLKIGAGVRPMGMGGAFCAVADDVNTVYWNPAGLVNISDKEFTISYTSWFEGIEYASLAYAQSLAERDALGGSLIYLNAKDTERDEWGEDISSFTNRDIAFSFVYGYRLTNRVAVGGGLKYIFQKLEKESATAFAFDLGTLYTLTENLTFGLSAQNMGSKVKFVKEEDTLPTNIRLGVACKPNKDFTLALDFNKPNDGDTYLCGGGEYWLENFAFRLGYRTGPADEGGNLTTGLGFKIEGFRLDYVYVPYGDLGDTHRVSLMMKF